MSNSVLELQAVAIKAREDLERGRVSRELLERLYVAYNPNVEIDSFLKEASKIFPRLNCGVASVYLRYVLGGGEIIQGKYNQENHTFLQVGEHIVDITADQFGGPKIYIGELKDSWSKK